jgi:hypothetical protein
MKFKVGQVNHRSLISLVLALLLLIVAATPALAWFDEGDVAGQASLPCRVISDGTGGHTVYCATARHHSSSQIVKAKPQLRPSIVNAELMVMPGQQVVQMAANTQ